MASLMGYHTRVINILSLRDMLQRNFHASPKNLLESSKYEPAHVKRDLLVFPFVVCQLCMHSALFRLQTCVFCFKIPQGLYYIPAINKCSGETALMRRLVCAFAVCLCDK